MGDILYFDLCLSSHPLMLIDGWCDELHIYLCLSSHHLMLLIDDVIYLIFYLYLPSHHLMLIDRWCKCIQLMMVNLLLSIYIHLGGKCCM